MSVREGLGRENREAPAARAHIEHRADGFRILNPRSELILEEFRNEGARNQHVFIAVEAVLHEPGFVKQIGHRDVFCHAALDQIRDLDDFVRGQPGIPERLEFFERQMQCPQHEECRFLPRIVGTVTERNFGGLHTGHGPADHIADCAEPGNRFMNILRHQIVPLA